MALRKVLPDRRIAASARDSGLRLPVLSNLLRLRARRHTKARRAERVPDGAFQNTQVQPPLPRGNRPRTRQILAAGPVQNQRPSPARRRSGLGRTQTAGTPDNFRRSLRQNPQKSPAKRRGLSRGLCPAGNHCGRAITAKKRLIARDPSLKRTEYNF